MKHKLLIITTLVGIFLAVNVFAYDGTGMWDYTEHTPTTTCPGPLYIPESGQVGILQTGSTFLIVRDDFSEIGSVNGNIYTYFDSFWEDEGVVTGTGIITLTSETTGTGVVTWGWTDGDFSCSGGHQLILSKQPQAAPVFNASGKWNFNQSGFSHTCDSATPPRSLGDFVVTQTGNRITAIDDLSQQYTGYVNGAEYAVVRTYLEEGGRTTEWHLITLSSATEGSGESHFVWDDAYDYCSGFWNISINKDVYSITATATAGGTISPSGTVIVDGGDSQEFQITADSGYVISDILVDNSSVGSASSYTFTSVSEDHSIHAIFQHTTNPAPFLLLLDE